MSGASSPGRGPESTWTQPAGDACCAPGDDADACCAADESTTSAQISNIARLYRDTDISDLPDTVTDAAFGCGNPTAISELQPGENVLDLGSGAGIDCFLAARMVGEQGKVYGVDMTPDMVHLARQNAGKVGATNVEFRLGEIEHLPVADATVDVVISNCVINLGPDKGQVFREAFRVLRPGGRLQVSDIVWTKPVPAEIRNDMEQWAGCIAGAMLEGDYLEEHPRRRLRRRPLPCATSSNPAAASLQPPSQPSARRTDG
ncbi:MAG: arsenite methyltransferase [Dehalococcoidia bacterium]|nr:arsenite methyltransferase [Dehalococcoidia bacterium]